MNRFAMLATVFWAAGLATGAEAQARPDFSGRWIRTVDSSMAVRPTVAVAASGDAAFEVGEMGSGWGTPLSITQEPNRLAIEYAYFSAYDLEPPIRLAYALDGTESRYSLNLGHAAIEQRARAAWDGNTLVITIFSAGPEGRDGRPITVEVRQALMLQSPTEMRIVTTRVGVMGGKTGTTQTVYTKR